MSIQQLLKLKRFDLIPNETKFSSFYQTEDKMELPINY